MNKKFYLDKVAIRLVKEPPLYSDYPLDSPQAVVKLMADTLKDYDREVFAIINLQSDLKPINVNIVSMGALDQSLAHPREIMKGAILSNAANIMMVHNHPSGRLVPSKEDIAITDRMSHICGILGIKLVEHIIVGRGDEYFSFHEKCTMPIPKVEYKSDINELELGGIRVAENINEEYSAEQKKDTTEEKIKGTKKKTQIEQSREKQANQLKEITDKLEQGVAEVFSSDKYKQFLNTMAKFSRYSVNNNMLIMMQKPDAQICQSFTGWKEMGRFVKKGEKGIKIIAPAPYTIQKEQAKLDERGNKILDRDGEPIMESIEIKINAFRVVSTFDISQTEGKELPTLGVDELMGTVEGYSTFIEALKQSCPVPITFEEIEGRAKGFYSHMENRIAIQDGMSEIQTIKTAIHEMAHQKLHSIENNGQNMSRNSKEVEAESVAYTVCKHYGIDTSDYSFSYIAGWSKGKEMPELKAALDVIRKGASEMILAIDEKLEVLMVQNNKENVKKQFAKEQSVGNNEKNVDRYEDYLKLVEMTVEKCSMKVKEKTDDKMNYNKISVKTRINNGKEKVSKSTTKKSKEKGAEACV